jgi:transposase
VPLLAVDPAGTSTTCPRCGAELVEVGYCRLRCPRCGLEADRDTIAVLNIERRALSKMGEL